MYDNENSYPPNIAMFIGPMIMKIVSFEISLALIMHGEQMERVSGVDRIEDSAIRWHTIGNVHAAVTQT